MVANNILKNLIENSKVRIKDTLAVRTKVEGMLDAGIDKLMVII